MNNEIYFNGFSITQNILLSCERGVLILQHKSGKWLLPGGHIESGEHWLEALKRELTEEIGHSRCRLQGVFDVDSWQDDGKTHYGVTFSGELLDDRISLGDEHIHSAYIKNRVDVQKYVFWHDSIKKRIEAFIDNNNLIEGYEIYST